MNNINFNKLFTGEFAKANAADFKKLSEMDQRTLNNPLAPKKDKLQIIERESEPIPADLQNRIQSFINLNRKQGKTRRQIRRMVKKKFNIMVVS